MNAEGHDEFGLPAGTAPPMPTVKPPRVEDEETDDKLERFVCMIRDAIDIADSSARADVECNCPWTYLDGADGTRTRWNDTSRIDPEDAEHIEQALRYLRARGRINQHPTRPELVNFDGVGE